VVQELLQEGQAEGPGARLQHSINIVKLDVLLLIMHVDGGSLGARTSNLLMRGLLCGLLSDWLLALILAGKSSIRGGLSNSGIRAFEIRGGCRPARAPETL